MHLNPSNFRTHTHTLQHPDTIIQWDNFSFTSLSILSPPRSHCRLSSSSPSLWLHYTYARVYIVSLQLADNNIAEILCHYIILLCVTWASTVELCIVFEPSGTEHSPNIYINVTLHTEPDTPHTTWPFFIDKYCRAVSMCASNDSLKMDLQSRASQFPAFSSFSFWREMCKQLFYIEFCTVSLSKSDIDIHRMHHNHLETKIPMCYFWVEREKKAPHISLFIICGRTTSIRSFGFLLSCHFRRMNQETKNEPIWSARSQYKTHF